MNTTTKRSPLGTRTCTPDDQRLPLLTADGILERRLGYSDDVGRHGRRA
ncbi:hypothetical protein [Arthrobacter cheniae]|nr:hypothetical protein [Arthrobacter cheniae]